MLPGRRPRQRQDAEQDGADEAADDQKPSRHVLEEGLVEDDEPQIERDRETGRRAERSQGPARALGSPGALQLGGREPEGHGMHLGQRRPPEDRQKAHPDPRLGPEAGEVCRENSGGGCRAGVSAYRLGREMADRIVAPAGLDSTEEGL